MSDSSEDATFYTQKRSCTILIIDDSDIDLEIYSRFLKKDQYWKFTVYATTEIEEFFEFLQTKSIDLVLTDYLMPEIDGLGLIERMRSQLQSRFHEICIIMMTGQGSESVAVEAMKKGASDYIPKQLITADFLQKTIKDNLYKFHLATELNKARVQIERNLIFQVGLNIRQSLDLSLMIKTAVEEIRSYLKCDRVFIYNHTTEGMQRILGESVNPAFPSAIDPDQSMISIDSKAVNQSHLDQNDLNQSDLDQTYILHQLNSADSDLNPEYLSHLQHLGVQSRIIIPISSNPPSLWGGLVADFCADSHYCQNSEIQLLKEICIQLSIGIQQSLLMEELKNQRDLATQSEKAKSSFLANMSHEIRTPMTAILGLSELLSKQKLNEESQYFLRLIQSSGQHLLGIINDILDLSKLESGANLLKCVEFSLRSLLDDLVNVSQVLLENKGLGIEINISEEVPDRYLGDSARLKQILTNLVSNAIKFTTQGNISIEVRSSCLLKPFKKISDLDQFQLYFSVNDRGIGIDSTYQDKLFKPFSQVENSATRSFQGTGLGLSICKKLVQLMGGEIGVNSILGEGSQFWFTVLLDIPIAPTSTESLTANPNHFSGLESSTSHALSLTRILVAEDNLVNQQLVRLMLNKMGYDCDIVENGELLLEVLNEKTYDLILMDCQMPVLDGYQTTAYIRQNPNFKNLVVIGLTAYAMEDDRNKCIDSGMNDFLTKPYTLSGLQNMIDKWMNGQIAHSSEREEKSFAV